MHVCCSPFASRDNIYNGPISIVAAVNDPADSEGTSYHIAFHVADVNPNSSPLPAAANNAMQSGNGTTGEASAQPIPKAVPMPPYPLDLKLSVKREGDKAVGTATITNPTKGTVQVRGSRLFTLMHTSARHDSTAQSHSVQLRASLQPEQSCIRYPTPDLLMTADAMQGEYTRGLDT